MEENGNQETEPEQNGSETVSESESTETSTKESPDESLVSGLKEGKFCFSSMLLLHTKPICNGL